MAKSEQDFHRRKEQCLLQRAGLIYAPSTQDLGDEELPLAKHNSPYCSLVRHQVWSPEPPTREQVSGCIQSIVLPNPMIGLLYSNRNYVYIYMYVVQPPIISSLRPRTSRRRVITRARIPAARDRNIIEREITAAAAAAKDVIILRTRPRRARKILEQEVGDNDAVGRDPGGPAVQVVLLHVDAVDRDVPDGDVAVGDVGDEAGGVEVRLDTCSILGVDDLAVGELWACQLFFLKEEKEYERECW